MGWLGENRFLSTPIGVGYLLEIDFIEREMQDWFHASFTLPFASKDND